MCMASQRGRVLYGNELSYFYLYYVLTVSHWFKVLSYYGFAG